MGGIVVINVTCKVIGQFHIRSPLQPSARNVKYQCNGGRRASIQWRYAAGEKSKLQTVGRFAPRAANPRCLLAKVMNPREIIVRCKEKAPIANH